jgi:hypothetical protein
MGVLAHTPCNYLLFCHKYRKISNIVEAYSTPFVFLTDGRVCTRELALHQILRLGAARSIVTVFDFIEKEIIHLRMRYWLAGLIQQQVLFRDIGDIADFRIFGEQVVIRLIPRRPVPFRNGIQPLFRIIKYGINIKNNAAKRVFPMLDDLADAKLRRSY